MTAYEYLNQVYYIDRKIKFDLMELEELRARATSISSPSFGEKVKSTAKTEAPFVRELERIWKQEAKVNAELNELEAKRAEGKSAIERLENKDERFILLYRYINRMTWEEIGLEMSMSERTVRRYHRSALSKIIVTA